MLEYLMTEVTRKLDELKSEEKEDNYITGYEKGFKDGFDAMYKNIDEEEKKEGYKDGYKQGKNDCEDQWDKIKDKSLDELIKKIDAEYPYSNFRDKSKTYINGFMDGYKKAFSEKFDSMTGEDYDEGYEDGVDDAEDDVESLWDNLDNEELTENPISLTDQKTIDKYKNKKDFEGKSQKYQEGYDKGYNESFVSNVNKLENEDKNDGLRKGQSKGNTKCDEWFEVNSDSKSLLKITVDANNKTTNDSELTSYIQTVANKIDEDKSKSSLYKEGYKEGIWKGFEAYVNKNGNKAFESLGENEGYQTGLNIGASYATDYYNSDYSADPKKEKIDEYRDGYGYLLLKKPEEYKGIINRNALSKQHLDKLIRGNQVLGHLNIVRGVFDRNVILNHIKDEYKNNTMYVNAFIEEYDNGFIKGYYDTFSTLVKNYQPPK